MSIDDRIKGYAAGVYEIAKAEGELDKVKSELQQIARTFETSNELRDALSDPRLPADRKQSIIDDLLGSRASEATVGIVSFVTQMGNAGSLPAIVDGMVSLSAAAGSKDVAEIRTAIALDDDVVARLVAALERKTGKTLEANVIVDPDVLGGIIARVGDTVIDGSVQKKLIGMRQAMAGR